MNYIFILLGNDSFYEAIIMSGMIDELPLSTGIFCFTGSLQTVYFSENERIFKIFLRDTMEDNKELFDKAVSNGQIDGIFIFDFHKAIFEKGKRSVFFDISWLENLNIPILLVDYLDIYSYNEFGQVCLTNPYAPSEDEQTEPAETEADSDPEVPVEKETAEELPVSEDAQEKPESTIISPYSIYPYILKMTPPGVYNETASKNFIYWNPVSTINLADEELQKMKEPLGIKDNRKNIFLFFSYQMIMRSAISGLKEHYPLIIKTIAHFLNNLEMDVNLFVAGIGNDVIEAELPADSKVKVKTFKTINHDLYKTLVSFADIIITDTTWNPVLLNAAALKIPAGVIGNSLSVQAEGSFVSDFESTDIHIFQEIEKAVSNGNDIFFPYTSFPLRADKFPGSGYYEDRFLYYLLDIYSDEVMYPFLSEFLLKKGEVSQNLLLRQEEYMKRAGQALLGQELIQLFIE